MLVSILGSVVLGSVAYFYAMRYNLHMFQLNGYKNKEHGTWLKKNLRQQWILLASIALGVLVFAAANTVCNFLLLALFALIIVVYRAMKQQNTKKKLVYTARVKRIITTDVILALICIVVCLCVGAWTRLSGLFAVMTGAQVAVLLLVNIINSPMEKGVNQHYINDAKRMLKQCPDLTVVGVTGSYGKTSVKFYLQTLLQTKYNVLVTPESYNTPMGVVRTIRGSLKSTHEIFICEMGARHVGDIKEICDIVHPKHGVITSVGPQHLETFFNMDNIKNTKFELADALPADGMLFLNGDNEFIQEKAASYSNKTFYYCTGEGEGYHAKDISLSQLGTEFTVEAPDGEKERFQMRLIGAHNVINVVGAIAVAHRLGISLSELKIPVRRLLPVEHRMQMREHGAVTIIDDAYNSNPVGSKAAVETLAMFDGTRILVTPGMVELGEKEEEYNYKFGTYAADCCDYILLVGKKRTKPIKEGVLSKGFPQEKCLSYDKLEDALSYAYSIQAEGHKYILLENDLPDNY